MQELHDTFLVLYWMAHLPHALASLRCTWNVHFNVGVPKRRHLLPWVTVENDFGSQCISLCSLALENVLICLTKSLLRFKLYPWGSLSPDLSQFAPWNNSVAVRPGLSPFSLASLWTTQDPYSSPWEVEVCLVQLNLWSDFFPPGPNTCLFLHVTDLQSCFLSEL